MQQTLPLACFLSLIRPPGVEFENALLQIAPVNKEKCPFVRDRADVDFQLYTRHNPTVPQQLVIDDDEALFASNMDFSAPTVIYFHAFMESPDEGSAVMIREAYMLRGDTNMIMVDASRLEAGPWYFTAAHNTWYIGKFAAQFIDYMVSRGLDLRRTHLVGHSLGSQSAGVAGSSLTSGRVSRITGLDPALPLFDKMPNDQKLDPTDAEFVDVIHTDAGIFGYNVPVGHVDFFPNGGISPQPGCELEIVIPQQLLLNKFFCSHWRSYMFYAESVIRPQSFVASACPSWHQYKRGGCAGSVNTHMGFGVDINTYVNTLLEIHFSGDKHSEPRGYYVFYLKPNQPQAFYKHTTFVSKLEKFFAYMRTLKEETKPNVEIIGSKKMRDVLKEKSYDKFKTAKINEQNNLKMNLGVTTRAQIEDLDIDDQRPVVFTVKPDEGFKTEDTLPDNDGTIVTVKTSTVTTDSKSTVSKDAETSQSSFSRNKRQKRFISFFKKTEEDENENFLFKALNFLLKNRKNIVPVYSVVREINTIVKGVNGELNHSTKEKNNFIGAPPPLTTPITYTLELGNESKLKAFLKSLIGLSPKGDRLTIGTGK